MAPREYTSLQQSVRDRIIWIRMAGRLSFVALFFASLYFSLANIEDAPVLEISWDKLNHAIGYFLLAASLDIGFRTGRHLLAKCAFVLAYSFLIEVVQLFFPYREFSLLDVAANALGVAVFVVLLPWLKRHGTYRDLGGSGH